ncbi:MAG: hypothetical protein L6N95_02385 [Candidatus Methylarchaceae archaeon HK01B]|nr:hypothetical protein [Candidatus Methylarchaceae archaeon HK01B]
MIVTFMSKKEKPEITPAVCFGHDTEKYYIEIEFPDASKEKIDLSFGEQAFCVKDLQDCRRVQGGMGSFLSIASPILK